FLLYSSLSKVRLPSLFKLFSCTSCETFYCVGFCHIICWIRLILLYCIMSVFLLFNLFKLHSKYVIISFFYTVYFLDLHLNSSFVITKFFNAISISLTFVSVWWLILFAIVENSVSYLLETLPATTKFRTISFSTKLNIVSISFSL